MLLTLIATATLAPHAGPTQAAPTCVLQLMPPAIDSAGEPPIASDLIEFAATPWLQYPGRAWVVRVSRRGQVEASVEVVRLRRQEDCSRYDVENRWRAPLSQQEYAAIAAKVAQVGVPAPGVFVPSPKNDEVELVTDGTGIDLRLRSDQWRVTRSLNHYETGEAAVSTIFRDLALRYIPASELPTEDWRTAPKTS